MYHKRLFNQNRYHCLIEAFSQQYAKIRFNDILQSLLEEHLQTLTLTLQVIILVIIIAVPNICESFSNVEDYISKVFQHSYTSNANTASNVFSVLCKN